MLAKLTRVIFLALVCAISGIAPALSAFAQVLAQSRIHAPLDSGDMRVVKGTAHPLARIQADRGRLNADTRIEGAALDFKLSASQQTVLNTLMAEQQDRNSANYHKWLTPDQYADRFGLTQPDIDKAAAWLKSQGFSVDSVSRSRTQIFFSGSVSQVESAFRTEIHHYEVNGELHYANASAVSVPSALADVVLGVSHLHDFRPRSRRARIRAVPMLGEQPRYSNSQGEHFIAPDDFATIYNVKPAYLAGFDGAGQTIGVIGQQTTINTSDIDAFRTAAGLPVRTSANFQQMLVANTGPATPTHGAEGEADLDLEWTQAVARNATIIYIYTGNSGSNDAFSALQWAISNVSATIFSISYGLCELDLGASNTLALQQSAQQANVQGQTIVSSSGDSGAADCESSSSISATTDAYVDVPASIPEVTGMGGSEFTADTGSGAGFWNPTNSGTGSSAIALAPAFQEEGWNDTLARGNLSATGGGSSVIFSKPSWQAGVGVPADGLRDVPDLALNSSPDHDGYLICSEDGGTSGPGPCTNGGFGDANHLLAVFGGTSVAAPTFAGVLALVNQKIGSNGLGNVNPALYALAAKSPNAFHDITTGNNIVPCTAGSSISCPAGVSSFGYTAGTGYDQVTGLGSVDADNLVNAWASYANTAPADFVFEGYTSVASGAGQSATSTLSFASVNGFSGTVNLTCAPPASVGVTCSITPSVTLPGSSTATLTISTSAPHIIRGVAQATNRRDGRFGWLTAMGAPFVAGFFAIGTFSQRRRWMTAFALVTLIALACFLVGCGGGGGGHTASGGTPAGIYTITVTASSSSPALTHSSTVAFEVQ